jgi:hypothetical protein
VATEVRTNHIRPARVLHEDETFLTLEVPKDETRELRIEDGDRFLTLIFVRNVDGVTKPWLPWETVDGD